MKFKKSISMLTVIIIVLSIIASVYGIFSTDVQRVTEVNSIHGNKIKLYGKGLYKNDSVSMASQAIAQGIVTLCLGIPVLIIAILVARTGSLRGRLLLAGMLGYFLYTYASYSFYAMYNSLYLIYIALMSLSFFGFTLTMMSFDIEKISSSFGPEIPVKFIGGVLIFVAALVAAMWLQRIVPPLMTGDVPESLEHYTTLVIQALDLGFVIPVAVLAAVLLIKRKAFGYLLSSIIIIKEAALLAAIIAMVISQMAAGLAVGIAELIIFALFAIMVVYCMYLIMRNVKEDKYNKISSV